MKERPHYVKWYKTANWHRLRAKRLKMEPLCRFCKEAGVVTIANTVDHKEPHKGDIKKFFNILNTQSLCRSCHSSTKQRLEKSGEFGCDVNGIVPAWRDK